MIAMMITSIIRNRIMMRLDRKKDSGVKDDDDDIDDVADDDCWSKRELRSDTLDGTWYL